jgi:uncharacterized membrane protein YeaQ/YmgE (transglycosylase-associated protein family)
MNPLIWLFVGALLGWLACGELVPAMPRDRIVNVLAGACGALTAGWLLSRTLGPDATALGDFSLAGLVEAAFGAVLLLVIVNLIRLIRTP